jgi:hypothetical protein
MTKHVIRWLPLREASAFIAQHHRHHNPPHVGIVALGVWQGERLVACGVIGRPNGRLHKPGTCEVIRTCVIDGLEDQGEHRNCVASELLGRLRRVAGALGFERMVTYTLESESGASLRGAGWVQDKLPLAPTLWNRPNRPRPPPTYPLERKIRWWRDVARQSELSL